MTDAQRQLLPAFLDAYPYPVSLEKTAKFRVRLFQDLSPPDPEDFAAVHGEPPSTDPQCRFATVMLQFSLGDEKSLWASFLYLPTTVPNDHRDRTRIEVFS